MSSKLFLSLVIILQLTYIHADENHSDSDVDFCESIVQKIRHEIWAKMSSSTKELWKIVPSYQNIQFFPIFDTISKNMALLQIHHDSGVASTQSKPSFLEEAYELACLLDKLQQSASVKLRFKRAIFYNNIYDINEGYLDDIKTYYHSEAYQVSFIRNKTAAESLIRSWMINNTKDRRFENENIWTPDAPNIHTNVIQYTGCWDTPKTDNEPCLFSFAHRVNRPRRSAQASSPPMLNFENETKFYLETFSSWDRVGYFHDLWLGFEAIRLPYKYNEFAMVVLLPYANHSLEMFVNFSAEDYRNIFQRVSNNYKRLHYSIPKLYLPMVLINEDGTSINSQKPVNCGIPQFEINNDLYRKDFKPFIVDRPFGMIIYHEKTKFVLWQAWIRDPISHSYISGRLLKDAKSGVTNFDRTHMF